MATQAVVSLTDDQGRTLFKVVAGSDGANASKLAAKLRRLSTWPTLRRMYDLAAACELGSSKCLVVMTPRESLYNPDDEEPDELGPRYRETFSFPLVNPRWECGLADHAIVVTLAETSIPPEAVPVDWFPPAQEVSVNVNKQEDAS